MIGVDEMTIVNWEKESKTYEEEFGEIGGNFGIRFFNLLILIRWNKVLTMKPRGILSPYPEPMFLSHIKDNLSTKLRKNGIFIFQDNKSVKRFTIAK